MSKGKCEPGSKYDGGKERWDLLPMKAVNEIVKVLTFGARKYDDDNWQLVPNARKRYYAAVMRHMRDAQDDLDKKDNESGLLHLAHAGCCIVFLIWFVLTGKRD